MAHIVKKNIGGTTYLYIQKSIYSNGKRSTQHIKYLGKESNWSKEDINKELEEVD